MSVVLMRSSDADDQASPVYPNPDPNEEIPNGSVRNESVPNGLARSAMVQSAMARIVLVRNAIRNDLAPSDSVLNAAIQSVMDDRRCPDVRVEPVARSVAVVVRSAAVLVHCVAVAVHCVAVAVHCVAVVVHCVAALQHVVEAHSVAALDRRVMAIHCVFQVALLVLNVPDCV
jgi:hypothetical protein